MNNMMNIWWWTKWLTSDDEQNDEHLMMYKMMNIWWWTKWWTSDDEQNNVAYFQTYFSLLTFLIGPIQPGFRTIKKAWSWFGKSVILRQKWKRQLSPEKNVHGMNLRQSKINAPCHLVTALFWAGNCMMVGNSSLKFSLWILPSKPSGDQNHLLMIYPLVISFNALEDHNLCSK
jgi:hypothetical protein